MAESNLRALLATAKGAGRDTRDAPMGDSEMEAILGVLKGEDAAGPDPSDGEGDAAQLRAAAEND
jgi:hypothetical protein